MQKTFMWLGIVLFLWLALVERAINSMYHISDYDDLFVTIINGSTVIYLALTSVLLYTKTEIKQNAIMGLCSAFMGFTWIYFGTWDMMDFAKTQNLGYLLFVISPPFVATYYFYWVVKCFMTIWNTNAERVCAIQS